MTLFPEESGIFPRENRSLYGCVTGMRSLFPQGKLVPNGLHHRFSLGEMVIFIGAKRLFPCIHIIKECISPWENASTLRFLQGKRGVYIQEMAHLLEVQLEVEGTISLGESNVSGR
jgi:hypothetical protein